MGTHLSPVDSTKIHILSYSCPKYNVFTADGIYTTRVSEYQSFTVWYE